ncbi:hypothetical protein ANCDUO_17986 [Ancylostoma duodenale]|uniref:Anaphase-promoting complex subunit 4 WD40 domain-containing protein n=1 Tax=Ancylostoma duodenale TaxID=51022 RepID=A0A0C2C6L4_9BILA|nr:hypothetical protein ANCDUO_17986 [Ancylostoma duodenale]
METVTTAASVNKVGLENEHDMTEGSNKICSLACTPNGVKLAVVGRDRIITLIDEKGDVKDRFSSKPLDSKYGKRSYIIRSICFSPDSSRLALGQSDNVVYVEILGYYISYE